MNDKNKNIKHIADIVGEWGRWQFHMCSFGFILYAMGAINNMGYTFHAYNNDFWCNDVPIDYPNKTIDMKCNQFSKPNESCTEWQYDRTVFNRSIVTEFNLVCGQSNFASLTQTSYMLSFIVSGLVLTYLQDKYGRRPMVWVTMIIEILGTLSCGLSTNMYQYIIARFFVGLGGSGRGAVGTIIIESTGPKHRPQIAIISGMGWILGYAIVPAYAYWLQDFRRMQLVSLVWMTLILVWFYFLHESVRWQIVNGQLDKAELNLRHALKINGKTDENVRQRINDLAEHLQKTKTENESKGRVTAIDLFRTGRLRKYTLIFWYSGIVHALIYYGFSLNMSDFGGNIYITFLLSGLIEIPAALIMSFVLRFYGRRLLYAISMFTISISSVGIIFTNNIAVRVIFALLGKYGVTSALMVRGIHTSEVFPTVLRQTGAGTIAMVARIGAISAPFMKNLAANTDLAVVMIIYAFASLSAGIIGFLLPETKGLEMPDTIGQTEQIGSTRISGGKEMETTF